MTQINLLPWREQARKEKHIRFGMTVLAAVCFTLFLILLLHIYYSSLIAFQERRNVYLSDELNKEETELKELNKKKDEQAEIIAGLNFIASLRQKSYKVVSMLSELVRVIPSGISLNKVVRTGDKLIIFGKAQSEVEITLLMKNIAKSTVFSKPELTEFTSKENSGGNEIDFQMHVEQQE